MRTNKLLTVLLIALFFLNFKSFGQEIFGSTTNIGFGRNNSYQGKTGSSFPVIHFDYEFGVVKNFTISPSVNFYSFFNTNYFTHPLRKNTTYQTGVQSGIKGTYYFDELLHAGSKWDFYSAGIIGISLINTNAANRKFDTKENNISDRLKPMYFDIHIGSEYHFNKKIGVFVDLSTGLSTIGIAIHE